MRTAWLLAALVILSCGCTAVIQDAHYSCSNTLRTQRAWLSASPSRLLWVVPSDYGRGWKQGYYTVAMGGTGQAPTLPPPRYWAPCYQCPEGQAAVAEWYEGFHNGAVAAEVQGAGRYHYLRPVGCPCPPYEPAMSLPGVNPQSEVPDELSPPAVPPENTMLEPLPPPESVTPQQNTLPVAPPVEAPMPTAPPATAPAPTEPAVPQEAPAKEASTSSRTVPAEPKPTILTPVVTAPVDPSLSLAASSGTKNLQPLRRPPRLLRLLQCPPRQLSRGRWLARRSRPVIQFPPSWCRCR